MERAGCAAAASLSGAGSRGGASVFLCLAQLYAGSGRCANAAAQAGDQHGACHQRCRRRPLYGSRSLCPQFYRLYRPVQCRFWWHQRPDLLDDHRHGSPQFDASDCHAGVRGFVRPWWCDLRPFMEGAGRGRLGIEGAAAIVWPAAARQPPLSGAPRHWKDLIGSWRNSRQRDPGRRCFRR